MQQNFNINISQLHLSKIGNMILLSRWEMCVNIMQCLLTKRRKQNSMGEDNYASGISRHTNRKLNKIIMHKAPL